MNDIVLFYEILLKIDMLNIRIDIDSVYKLLEEFDTNFDFNALTKNATPFSDEVYKNVVSLIRKRCYIS